MSTIHIGFENKNSQVKEFTRGKTLNEYRVLKAKFRTLVQKLENHTNKFYKELEMLGSAAGGAIRY